MNGPRDFFEEMIKPAHDEWNKDRLSERKIRALTIFLDSMADWMFVSLSLNYKSVGKYRNYLAQKTNSFEVVRDTADCTKHLVLERPTAKSTRADLQKLTRYDCFNEVENVGRLDHWNTLSVWIVEDGQSRWYLSYEIEKVMAMWQAELEAYGL